MTGIDGVGYSGEYEVLFCSQLSRTNRAIKQNSLMNTDCFNEWNNML